MKSIVFLCLIMLVACASSPSIDGTAQKQKSLKMDYFNQKDEKCGSILQKAILMNYDPKTCELEAPVSIKLEATNQSHLRLLFEYIVCKEKTDLKVSDLQKRCKTN